MRPKDERRRFEINTYAFPRIKLSLVRNLILNLIKTNIHNACITIKNVFIALFSPGPLIKPPFGGKKGRDYPGLNVQEIGFC